MRPLTVDTLVRYDGGLYFVDEVLEGGANPLYKLRRTALKLLARNVITARHSEIEVRGGVIARSG